MKAIKRTIVVAAIAAAGVAAGAGSAAAAGQWVSPNQAVWDGPLAGAVSGAGWQGEAAAVSDRDQAAVANDGVADAVMLSPVNGGSPGGTG